VIISLKSKSFINNKITMKSEIYVMIIIKIKGTLWEKKLL